ncbi:MAG: hypothetical protein MUC35_01765 [Candidatus Margulisbacteria bacterium]|jgi:hypothetical protein|nr:hypothetical protein [Candidatus Margulisiibacteriota bacterium]
MKNGLLTLLAVSFLVIPALAGLLEDVDKLTPEQAELFQKKLEQKKFEGLHKNTRFGGGVQLFDPAQFNAAFPGLPAVRNLYGGSFDVRQPINDKLLIGGSFGGAGNYTYRQSATKVYEDLFFAYGSAQLVLEWRLYQNKNFLLSVTPGAGVMLGGYNYNKTNDNTKTTYNTNRWGSGTCSSLGLDLTWKISDEWGMGLGASAFSGKLGGFRKVLSEVDTTAPEIDLTGTIIRITGTKAF